MAADSTAPLRLRHLWWSLLAIGQLGLVVLSLLPLPIAAPDVPLFDKWAHLLAHASLSAAAMLCFRSTRGRVCALAWQLLLGVLIEGLQGLVPWRSMEAADLVANALGVGLGASIALTPLRDLLGWIEARILPRPGGDVVR